MIYLQCKTTGPDFFSVRNRMQFAAKLIHGEDLWEIEDNPKGKAWADEKVLFAGGKIISGKIAQKIMADHQAQLKKQVEKDSKKESKPVKKGKKKS